MKLVLILAHQGGSPLSLLQLKQPDKAAAAAHTFFLANPEHVEMGENLEHYKDLEGVQEDHFVDREAQPHQVGLSDPAKLQRPSKMATSSIVVLRSAPSRQL